VPKSYSHLHFVSTRAQVEAKQSYRAISPSPLERGSPKQKVGRVGATTNDIQPKQASLRHEGVRQLAVTSLATPTASTSIINRQHFNRGTIMAWWRLSLVALSPARMSLPERGRDSAILHRSILLFLFSLYLFPCSAFPLRLRRQSSANFLQTRTELTIEEYHDGERDVESRHHPYA
jgi:hypothetical protein